MKKSFDYFKTLKLLSEAISEIYVKILFKKDFSSERIRFFAEKSELINNLQNEFITPFERGDIFLLGECLSDELDSVLLLQKYSDLISYKDFVESAFLAEALKSQTHIFSRLNNFKSNLKLFEECSDEIKNLNEEKKKTENNIVYVLKCGSEQPLIKYSVFSLFIDLNRSIYKTIVQIERILINNS